MFALLSDTSFFHDKLDIFIACAPIVYLSNNQESMLRKAADEWQAIYLSANLLGLYEVNDGFLNELKLLCT